MEGNNKSQYKKTKKLWNGRFEQSDLDKWKKRAAMQSRSLTNLIEIVMNKHCK